MKKIKRIALTGITVLTIGGMATGCTETDMDVEDDLQTTEEETEVSETTGDFDEEVLDLTDWSGTWNSITYYLDEEEVQGAFEVLADRENSSPEDSKANYKERVSLDFTAMIIEGDKITYLDGLEDEGGEVIETVAYEFQEEKTTEHGGQALSWYKFIATEEADHEAILLIDVHGEETMPHFHFRYGEEDEELIDREDWYPTLIGPTTTLDQVYEEIAD